MARRKVELLSDADPMGMSSDEFTHLSEIERQRQQLREDELTHFDRYPHMCLDIEGDWVPCPDHLCEAWRSVQAGRGEKILQQLCGSFKEIHVWKLICNESSVGRRLCRRC